MPTDVRNQSTFMYNFNVFGHTAFGVEWYPVCKEERFCCFIVSLGSEV
jgi:hypothetical protein